MKKISIKSLFSSIILTFLLLIVHEIGFSQSFSDSLLQNNNSFQNPSNVRNQNFIPPEEAFVPEVFKKNEQEISLLWQINPDYYLYKNKIYIDPLNKNIEIKEIIWPETKEHNDEFFGTQPIYDHSIEITIKFKQPLSNTNTLHLNIEAQGCAKAGLCYPPYTWETQTVINTGIKKKDELLSADDITKNQLLNEHDRLSQFLLEKQYLALPLFFLLGLLLTFTPCVLPMLPILSGILTGEKNLTKSRGFLISLSYVLAMAMVYTTIGIIAATLGSGLTAAFQNKYVIMGFSSLFVILSLGMFGVYQIQTPVFIQNKLNSFSNKTQSGSYVGAMIMGALSALIVGPCVTAPLIGIITLIAQTQDYILGGFALFSMSMGMGVPLLILGISSGYILPKVGAWMNAITEFFGFVLLAMAAYFLGRILPYFWENILYAALALSLTIWFFVKIFKSKQLHKIFIVPALLTLGFTGFYTYESLQPKISLDAIQIDGLNGLNEALQNNNGRLTMLEFNAEWCVACKEMEKYVFSDQEVKERLERLNFLSVDVTENNKVDQQIQKHFGIIGPPAILFFDTEGNELPEYRVMGSVPANKFRDHLDYILGHHPSNQGI